MDTNPEHAGTEREAPGVERPGTATDLTVTDLLVEQTGDDQAIERRFEEALSKAREAVPTDDLIFGEDVIKENLRAVVVLLVWVRDGSHGKQVIEDIDRLFDVRVSPGTLYPTLHELADGDVLSKHERVRTKEYRIADEDRGVSILAESFLQHLAFGYSLYWAHAEILDHGAD